MKVKIRQRTDRRKRMRLRRIVREQWQEAASVGSVDVEYEMSERASANSARGIGLAWRLVQQRGLPERFTGADGVKLRDRQEGSEHCECQHHRLTLDQHDRRHHHRNGG